ncbi:hypothetical protein ACKFR8_08395 [Corynebacterium axilliensis]|uniref:hypothetical protein n=1 Tax=Corynebacterium sp. YSMAA5_1_F9 TaxID=3383591 RepID=UPI0038D1ED76
MDLTELLTIFDRSLANLKKLDDVWERAKTFMPQGPAVSTDPEYEDLRRAWEDLLPGLPPIEGWTIVDELPDIVALGQALWGYAELGEPPLAVWAAIEKPAKDLAEYRYKLNRSRRMAVRDRLEQLVVSIESDLSLLLEDVERDSSEVSYQGKFGTV